MYIWEQSMPIPHGLSFSKESLDGWRSLGGDQRRLSKATAKNSCSVVSLFWDKPKWLALAGTRDPCWGRHDCHFMPWHPSNFAIRLSGFERVHLRSFHNFPQPDMLQPTNSKELRSTFCFSRRNHADSTTTIVTTTVTNWVPAHNSRTEPWTLLWRCPKLAPQGYQVPRSDGWDMCIYIYIYVCMYVWVYIYMCVCACVCVCTYTYIYIHINWDQQTCFLLDQPNPGFVSETPVFLEIWWNPCSTPSQKSSKNYFTSSDAHCDRVLS